MKTIYQVAQELMRVEIDRYLYLAEVSDGFNKIEKKHLIDHDTALLFCAGIDSQINVDEDNYQYLINDFKRKPAVLFDIENAVSMGVYRQIRPYIRELYAKAIDVTNGFTKFNPIDIKNHPYLLPVFQSLLGYSKSQLKKKVGSISDNQISNPASIKLVQFLSEQLNRIKPEENNIIQRMEITLEGIIRDLVGKFLFEDVVANALDKYGVHYLREGDYTALSGVIYDFRADFILPNPENPMAFIEVRKSSSRHASLYAKDKMFSAINWKGKHKSLIGVIVVEGEWTQATLKTMAYVFDYVVPLSKINELAQILKKAQEGDKSILRWLIEFSIKPSPWFTNDEITPTL